MQSAALLSLSERLRPSCQIVSGRWSRFSWQSSAAAMPVYFAKRCMKFTFRGFSEGMLPSLPTSSEPEGHCSLSWLISSNTGRWGSPMETGVEGQSLTAEDQLFILTQAALYLTVTRGFAAPEARICHERVESFCHSLNRPLLLHSALMGQWRYSLLTDKLTVAMQIAKRIDSLAQEQNDAALMLGAYSRFGRARTTFLGDFDAARQSAIRGLHIWRSGDVQSQVKKSIRPSSLV